MAAVIPAVDVEALLAAATTVGSPTNPDVIVVTGFGPFGVHNVNASWEAVKKLASLDLEKQLNVRLVCVEVPVRYDVVKKLVPEIWLRYKPKLVVHCGVSSIAQELVLEQQAHNTGYHSPDITNCLPDKNCCHHESTGECITSGLDLANVSVDVSWQDVTCTLSTEAGRFLCEFIYYSSLSIDKDRSVFIHVPDLTSPPAVHKLATGIAKIITALALRVIPSSNTKMELINNSINYLNETNTA